MLTNKCNSGSTDFVTAQEGRQEKGTLFPSQEECIVTFWIFIFLGCPVELVSLNLPCAIFELSTKICSLSLLNEL